MSKDVGVLLAEAAAAVAAADLPEDLREVAFSKAVDLLAGEGAPEAPVKIDGLPVESSEPAIGWGVALTQATGRSAAELEHVFFLSDDGDPLVGVNPSRLGANAATRTRSCLLLLACARQVSGFEDRTQANVLRAECQRLGIYDQANFGATLGGLRDWFNITGSGGGKIVRVKPGGRDAFKKLLDELVDDGE